MEDIKGKSDGLDFHAHVLPAMDDGSESARMSCAMLLESARQGVKAMVATPHFYPETERPGDFLARRERSVRALLDGGYDESCHPVIYQGAEVAYFPGLAHCEELDRLCIVGTKTILIEMPFSRWTEAVIADVLALRSRRGFVPVLAHVDRYSEVRNAVLLRALAEQGVVLQINADAFDHPLSRRRTLRLLKEQTVQLVGSDCHNMTNRLPNLGSVFRCMGQKLDAELLFQMEEFGRFVLDGAQALTETKV